jgi:hypothetical protein
MRGVGHSLVHVCKIYISRRLDISDADLPVVPFLRNQTPILDEGLFYCVLHEGESDLCLESTESLYN